MLFVKADLDRREHGALNQAFYGRDVVAVDLDGQLGTRLDGLSIEQHGAGAAAGGVTADMSAGEGEIDPQEVDQEDARFHVACFFGAVDSYGHLHDFTP